MSDLLVIGGATVLTLAVPLLAHRLVDRRASARVTAGLHLLVLTGVAVAPVALLVCAAGVGSPVACAGGKPGHALRWLAIAVAGALVLRLLYVAARTTRATVRATPRWLRRAAPTDLAGGIPVHVVPAREPIGFSAGMGRGRIVVTDGLLRIMEDDERRAVLAHEAAHVRGGHPRLLLMGRAVAEAFGALPPVRRAFASLRRELEAIADEEAVRDVGDPNAVARAIAKAGLAGARAAPGPALGETDLLYRLHRLLGEASSSRVHGAVAVSVIAVLGLGLALSQCAAFHPGSLLPALLACSAVASWVAVRPFLGSRAAPVLSGRAGSPP